MKNLPIRVKVGDVVERIMEGQEAWLKTDGRRMVNGTRGVVVKVSPPEQSTGIVFFQGEEDEMVDPGVDGNAIVEWSTWGRGVIWRVDERKCWRRIKASAR